MTEEKMTMERVAKALKDALSTADHEYCDTLIYCMNEYEETCPDKAMPADRAFYMLWSAMEDGANEAADKADPPQAVA